ncbi:MAG: hypothetical protein ACRDO8_00040 [Nocardioidaceae bacterium]
MSLLTEHERRTLVRMIEVIFPHDSFPAGPYERAAEEVLSEAAQNPRLQAQLIQGLYDLDVLREVPFVEMPPDVALTVLRGIQDAPFFQSILGIVVVKFYDDHEVWDLLGYEGPSFDRGGYVDRGFDDLDWLPSPRIEEATT